MRDLLSKLDAIISETELKNPEDLQAKRQALADLEKDPVAGKDPEISSAIAQRKTDLEREAKSKGFDESFELDREELKPAHDKGYGDAAKGIDKNPFNPDSPAFKSYREGQMAYKRSFGESFEIGDEFGISFSEDHEIATTIVDMLEDGIVIELDDLALEMLTNEGLNFLDGELEESVAGPKKCWKGYRKTGTQPGTGKNAGKRVNDCEKIGEDLDESGLQRYTGIKKYGKDGFEALQKAGREGADEEEKGRIKDKYLKKEDHGPENPDAPVNYGEYDREGDMAKDDLRTIDDAAEELYSILRADDNLPEWVQSKITKAVDYIDTARDYMKAQNYEEGVAEAMSQRNKDQGAIGHGLPWKRYDDLDQLAQDISDKILTITNIVKLNSMAHDSTIYNALERYFKKYGYPDNVFNRVASIVFKKLDDEGRRMTTDPRIQEQGMAEGLPQTLRKVVPGYAKREIDKKMDDQKFGRTDVDKDANYYRYKKIQDKIKNKGVAEEGYGTHPSQRVDPRTGKKYIPPKSPLGKGVAEGKDEKIAQLKKDHATAVHWSKNDTNPHKREAARQKAEKIKRHLDTQYKQGVAEGDVDEAKYQGREVPLGKKMAGDVKKSKVYVRKPNGNIVKVNFGDKKMRIKKSNPARRKSFRARHNCANPGPRHKARYWSCRSW